MGLIKHSIFLGACVALTACSKKSHSSSSSGETNTSGRLALSNNELAAAYPEGLAVTAFPQAIDSTPGEAATGTLVVTTGLTSFVAPEGPDFTKHPKELLEDTQKVLAGEVDCFSADVFNGLIRQTNTATDFCYGFDYGIVSGTLMGGGDAGQVNPAISSATSTADAKSKLQAIVTQANTSGEACMVGTARNMVSSVVGKVESALKLFQGMFCQAKKDGLATELPAVGTEVDLVSVFEAMPTLPNATTYNTATIKRLADKNERPVYQTTLSFTSTTDQGVIPYSINLVHSPGADSNENYDGVMWIQSERTENQKTFNIAFNISYSKTGSTFEESRLKFDLRSANIRNDYTPFFDTGVVDYNAGADASGNYPGQANDYLSSISYFAFDVNPSNYAGKIAFWTNPGGNYAEAARGFVFESEQDSAGKMSGCAYAGAYRAGSIRMAMEESKTLKPTGCFTPQLTNGACGAPGDNQGTQIWKQCFAQNDEALYVVDTTKTTDTAAGFDILEAASVTVPEFDFSGQTTFDGAYSAE